MAYLRRPIDLKGYPSLVDLALDLQWSWNDYGDKIWGVLDPEMWDMTSNPWVVLQTVSQERLTSALPIPIFARALMN